MFSTLVSMATPRQTNAPSPMKKLPETKYANHKDDRNMVTSPSATLGKTSKVFQEMLTNLGKEKVARQQPSRSPLRDETKRVLNSYYPNNGLLAHGMAERTTANTQKDAWSSRLNRAEENKPRVDQKKTEVRDKSARKTIIGTPSNTISYKEGYKTGWKPSEKPKLSYPLKKPAVDDRLKYDRGEFTRYLDRK